MKKVVIFDLDGTLLDTLGDLQLALNDALERLGYPKLSKDEVCNNIGDGLRKLIERSTNSQDELVINKGIQYFTQYYQNHLHVVTKPFDGIKWLLTSLKEEGFICGVLSNKDDYAVKELCDLFFAGMIDYALGHIDGMPVKPHPTLLQKVLDDLGVSNIIYVGDSDTDALTIINNNLIGVLVSWGYRNLDILNKFNLDIASNVKDLKKIIVEKASMLK